MASRALDALVTTGLDTATRRGGAAGDHRRPGRCRHAAPWTRCARGCATTRTRGSAVPSRTPPARPASPARRRSKRVAADPGSDPLAVQRLIGEAGSQGSLAALHQLVLALGHRERTAATDAERAGWTLALGAAHHALAARGSRLARLDLRDALERTPPERLGELVAAAEAVGDAACLAPLAAAWTAGEGPTRARVAAAFTRHHGARRAHPPARGGEGRHRPLAAGGRRAAAAADPDPCATTPGSARARRARRPAGLRGRPTWRRIAADARPRRRHAQRAPVRRRVAAAGVRRAPADRAGRGAAARRAGGANRGRPGLRRRAAPARRSRGAARGGRDGRRVRRDPGHPRSATACSRSTSTPRAA